MPAAHPRHRPPPFGMDSLHAGDADMRAAAEASLFETDADSDTSEGTAAPTSPPVQQQRQSSKVDAPPESPRKASARTDAESESPLTPLNTSHAFPSPLASDRALPAATSPPLTPGTPSHRPRPRTRTRTRRQSRMHAHPSTSADAIGAASFWVNGSPAANELANLLAHSPSLASAPPAPTPSAAAHRESQAAPRLEAVPVTSPSASAEPDAPADKVEISNNTGDDGSVHSTAPASAPNESDAPTSAPNESDALTSAPNEPDAITSASAGSEDSQPTSASAQLEEANPEKGPEKGESDTDISPEDKQLPGLAARFSKHLTLQPPASEEESVDWEFWGAVMNDYQKAAREQPDRLAKAIRAGIPPTLRGAMWQLMSGSKSDELEQTYASYLDQSSAHDKAIKRDLLRTYPDQVYFRPGSRGQDELYNVVKAYALLDPEVGYCQGMQFIVGPLLLQMPDEEAFSCWVRLMRQYNLRGHFLPGMSALQLRLYQFTRLLEDLLPRLHAHLVRQGVKPSMYASPWLMTLFCYRFPLEAAFRVLDTVIAEGIDSIFRFALLLMEKNESTLLSLDFEGAVLFLKERVLDVYQVPVDMDESSGDPTEEGEQGSPSNPASHAKPSLQFAITPFSTDAAAMAERISAEKLDEYATEYQIQLEQSAAPLQDLEDLRQKTWRLAAKVRELEQDAESQELSHVELMKQVVAATLARDEVAEQLVQYKTMYAEAVLAKERAAAGEDVPPRSTSPALSASHMETSSSFGGSTGIPAPADKVAAPAGAPAASGGSMAHSVSAKVASWGRWMSRSRTSRGTEPPVAEPPVAEVPAVAEELARESPPPEDDAATKPQRNQAGEQADEPGTRSNGQHPDGPPPEEKDEVKDQIEPADGKPVDAAPSVGDVPSKADTVDNVGTRDAGASPASPLAAPDPDSGQAEGHTAGSDVAAGAAAEDASGGGL